MAEEGVPVAARAPARRWRRGWRRAGAGRPPVADAGPATASAAVLVEPPVLAPVAAAPIGAAAVAAAPVTAIVPPDLAASAGAAPGVRTTQPGIVAVAIARVLVAIDFAFSDGARRPRG